MVAVVMQIQKIRCETQHRVHFLETPSALAMESGSSRSNAHRHEVDSRGFRHTAYLVAALVRAGELRPDQRNAAVHPASK